MKTPQKPHQQAPNSEYTLKRLFFNVATNVIGGLILLFLGGIPYHLSGTFNRLIRGISHGLIMPALVPLIVAAVPLVLSFVGCRLYLWRAKKPAEGHNKARIATRIAGLLGLAILTSVTAALVVSRNTPFEVVVLDPDTVHKEVEIVVKRDVSDLWINIAGTSMDLSLELDWRPSRTRDREILVVSGLPRDREIEQSVYFHPEPGFFKVSGKVVNTASDDSTALAPGEIKAGTTLALKTKKTSGFEGELYVEFWDSPKEGAQE
jgi:hypothetical protein